MVTPFRREGNAMAKPLLRLALTALVAGLALASCILMDNPEGDEPGWRTIPDRGEERPADEERTETSVRTPPASGTEFREVVDFRPGETLSLENDYGDVEIIGWDRDEVEVVARPSAAASDRREPRSARQAGGRAVPAVELRETSRGLLVRTPTFEGPGRPPAVIYEVRVPHSVSLSGIRVSEGDLTIEDVFGRLEAAVDEGNLRVKNYSGPLRATVGIGTADVEVLDLRDGDEITITSSRGDIVLRLESGAGAIVEADAPRGEVSSDFDLGKRLPAPTVKGWIGQGGPAIILRAADGKIEIIRTRGASGRAESGK